METLSRREEEEIMESAKKQALKACDDFVKGESSPNHSDGLIRLEAHSPEFADCATGRTFSLPFTCRSKLQAMQGCMKD